MRFTYLLIFIGLNFWMQSVAGQQAFRPGYIIDNDGERINVMIKVHDASSNPTSISYRTSENERVVEAEIADLAEFGLIDKLQRFVRAEVDIEQSSDALATLSTSPHPQFKTDIVWLRQLVDGGADLFYWADGRFTRYFYRVENSRVLPLIYRRYREGTSGLRTDIRYRATLASVLNCAGDLPRVSRVDYTTRSLLNFFIAYNTCVHAEQVVYTDPKSSSLRVAVRLGGESRSPVFSRSSGFSNTIALGSQIFPTFGVEVEQPLRFTNRRWSIFLGVNYRSHQQVRAGGPGEVSIDSRSLEFPFGARWSFISRKKASAYLMGALVSDFPLGNAVFHRSKATVLHMGHNFGGTFGAGVRIGRRLEVEGRYRLRHGILSNYRSASLSDRGVALTAAYRL